MGVKGWVIGVLLLIIVGLVVMLNSQRIADISTTTTAVTIVDQGKIDARNAIQNEVARYDRTALDTFISHNETRMRTLDQSALFATAAEHETQIVNATPLLHMQSLKAFALGTYFLSRKDNREARRQFILAASLTNTPATHLMIGYLHSALGNHIAASEELNAVISYARAEKNSVLETRANSLIGTFARDRSAMVGGTFIAAGGISLLLILVPLGFYLRSRAQTEVKRAWLAEWPPLTRVAYLKKIRNATFDELEEIEEEICAMGEEEEWPALPSGSPLQEIVALKGEGDQSLSAARSWLAAHFLVRVHSHRKALHHFHAALDIADGPLLSYMLARSFVTLKKESAAERAFQRTASRARSMGNDDLRDKAEEWLKKLS